MSRRVVVYARLSVSAEASVSIERQIESAEHYAAARGWTVVGRYIDDGVSATHNRPDRRAGWRALLAASETYDTVIVWKLDRLARRIVDFWDAVKALEGSGRTLVSVADNLDMSTTVGQIVAGVLAGFAQMEAEAISDRVRAARGALLRSGRLPGGAFPYGWRAVPNPDGPGWLLAQDPARVGYVRGAVERVQEGASIYSVVQWLDEVGAPLPTASQKNRKTTAWSYTTVERLLRNPVLAGMMPYNPGNTSHVRGADVLRGPDGLPVVDESVAIMSPQEWRAMVRALDERDSAQSRPRALKAKTSALLSGLVYCGEHLDDDGRGTRMHRGTVNGRPGYYCPVCHQAISNWEHVVVAEFLRQKGPRLRLSVVREVREGGALLPEIEHRLDELDALIRAAPDRAARAALQAEQANLLDLRDEQRAATPSVVWRPVRAERTYAEDWAAARTVTERRAVLDDALERIWVVRGRPGRRSDAAVLARLVFDWRFPEELGPDVPPPDATLARWAADNPVPARKPSRSGKARRAASRPV